ncbi:MAG: adenosine deaminase [Chloroflexota bacterium]
MTLTDFIKAMPKAELHVHLQGGTQPETLLRLAQRHNIAVPAQNVDEMRQWYTFRDFDHFLDIYDVICECFRTGEDIELAFREFCAGQASQNIRYTEVTFTPPRRIAWVEQLAALKRGRDWAREELGIIVNVILDIPREYDADVGNMIADWVIDGAREGAVVAIGLGGPEADNPAARFAEAFDRVHAAGIPTVLHAGEHVGPESIWDALKYGHSARIGHGVRCLEDPKLVDHLREHQIPLEVCPTSNVLLKVCETLADHPLPKLMEAGLYVTVNSDDPPMFNATLTDELTRCAETFQWDSERLEQITIAALRAAFSPEGQSLIEEYQSAFKQLRETEKRFTDFI